jgi:Mrp family chromosome partitioning ATPase
MSRDQGPRPPAVRWPALFTSGQSAEVALPGFVNQPRESLDQSGLDRAFVDACRRAFSGLAGRLPDTGVVAVTSPYRGEGRSSVAAGLAIALSRETEGRVLLADFDVSRPSLARRFGVDPEPGVVDHLEDRAALRVIGGGPSRRLWLLPAGTPPRNGLSRFVHLVSVSGFFDSCRQAFAWTVLDLPPLLDNPEAALLVRSADACVLVGRYRTTAVNAVSRAAEMIPPDCPTGFVLTEDTSRVPAWIARLL